MKRGFFVITLILTTVAVFGQSKDSCYAGVYLTKADFVAKHLTHKINENIKGDKLKFTFPADLTFTIKIISPDSTIIFKPGTIFGYYECGEIFRYSPGTEWNGQEDYYKIEESKGLIIYSSAFISGAESFYSLNPTSPIHRLTMKNLEVDFKDHPDFIIALKKLNKDVDDGLATRNKDGSFIVNQVYRETLAPRK